jgi:hypothetical protein
LEEVYGNVNANITKISEVSNTGTKSFILVDNKPSALFDVYTDSASTIKTAIDSSFGIKCPNSIQINNRTESFETFDYEGCSWGDALVKEAAFCGKCANTNIRTFFSNVNVSLSFEYVRK